MVHRGMAEEVGVRTGGSRSRLEWGSGLSKRRHSVSSIGGREPPATAIGCGPSAIVGRGGAAARIGDTLEVIIA